MWHHVLAYDAENIKELQRFQSCRMEHDLEAFLPQEYPEFRPGHDTFGLFVQRLDGRLDLDLDRYLSWLSANPHALPTSDEENAVRSFLAKEIVAATTGRNLGYVKETDTCFIQYGVDFFNQSCTTLLIGGTIYHKCKDGMELHSNSQAGSRLSSGVDKPQVHNDFERDLWLIAAGTQYDERESWSLRPKGPTLLDAAYMISIAGGLYGHIDPERALRMLKRHMVSLE